MLLVGIHGLCLYIIHVMNIVNSVIWKLCQRQLIGDVIELLHD